MDSYKDGIKIRVKKGDCETPSLELAFKIAEIFEVSIDKIFEYRKEN